MRNSRQSEMPKQSPEERRSNFREVALGLDPELAVREAKRCIQCKTKPCTKGCPVEVEIPDFIALMAQGKFREADAKIKEKNSLPAICGRVCPQESQCESLCTLGKKFTPVAVGALERFAPTDPRAHPESGCEKTSSDGPAVCAAADGIERPSARVAVIGSGPAGLTCAAELALMGYRVDIYESLHETGGVLRYGIPEFRLPKAIVNQEVDYVRSLGVRIFTNVLVGMTLDLNEMLAKGEYQAAFIGTGAGLPYFLEIPGENLNGVYSANEFLTRVNLMKAYKFPEYDTPVKIGRRVAVVGAGNVAMDARVLPSPGGRGRQDRLQALARRCRPVWRRSSTPRRKACRCSCSPTPSASSPTARAGSGRWSASRWNWASPTPAGAGVRYRVRVRNSPWTLTPS